MTKPQPPFRAVVESKRGPRCQRINLPGGGTAMVCGPAPYFEKLACGHEGVWWAKATKRRCEQCLEEQLHPEPPLEDLAARSGGGPCPGCGRIMSAREGAEQGACNDCSGPGPYLPEPDRVAP